MDENTNNAMDDWKKRPMMVPITIRLQPGLHSQEVHIMHPLNADVSSEFVEREASELAKQANGDAAFIKVQLEQANRIFHDAEGRRVDPEVVVLTIVAPIGTSPESDGEYMLLHRCYWDIHTPHAMVDVYCGDVVNDMGFDSSTADLLSRCMKSEIDAMRQTPVSAPQDTSRRDILVESKQKMVFPIVIKGGRDVAERMKESLKDVPFGQEQGLIQYHVPME